MKRSKWKIFSRFPHFWFVLDPTCELLPKTSRCVRGAFEKSPCVCGAFPTWGEAVAYVNRVERERAVAAIQDGAR